MKKIMITFFMVTSVWGVGASVLVKSALMQKRSMTETVLCYGQVAPPANKMETISMPRAGQIVALYVISGERVKRGQNMAEFSTSPDASAVYLQSKHAVDFAAGDLERTRIMEKEHLATASQVALAKKSLDDAQAVYVSQLAQQSNRTLEKIKAPFDGVISNNIAMLGERLNMGQPILSIFKESELKAVFGVNPKHLKNVKIGQKVEITSVFDSGSKLSSKIQKISGMINPQTRLIDIIVPIPTANNTLWLSGIQIRGTIVLNEEAFFTVAKSTILSDTDGSFIFQIKNTKAVKVAVRRLREQNGFVAISGDFDPLLKVIHEGNYELSSGMTIRENRR